MNHKRPSSKQPIPPHAKKVFSGIIYDVYQWEQEQFDGTTKLFEKIARKDTVTVIPVTTDGMLILTEQEQPGTEPFIGFPGGVIDDNEDPLPAAKRELLEETGYEAQDYVLWGATQLLRQTEWAMYTFIAKGCKKITEQHVDAGEKIKLRLVTFDEFITLASLENFRDIEIALKVFKLTQNPEQLKKTEKLFFTE